MVTFSFVTARDIMVGRRKNFFKKTYVVSVA